MFLFAKQMAESLLRC